MSIIGFLFTQARSVILYDSVLICILVGLYNENDSIWGTVYKTMTVFIMACTSLISNADKLIQVSQDTLYSIHGAKQSPLVGKS